MSERTDETPEERGGFRLWMLIPALGAAAVLAVFMLGLQRDDVMVLPSPLIDKPVPEFALEPLTKGQPGLSAADLKAPGVKLVNVWASWCGPCRAEHPQLIALAGRGIPLHGINYKDEPANAAAFLDDLGNPFEQIGADTTGRTGIDFGVYGVPETFVVDGDGTIVYRHVGPIMPQDVERYILPAVEKASAGR
jgi:cytochrome c biogenesis protein CcmG, thiol:disulfide interchange protein DsbE